MRIFLDREDGSDPLDVTEAVRILWDTSVGIHAAGSGFYDQEEEADLEVLREAAGFLTENEYRQQRRAEQERWQERWRAQEQAAIEKRLAPVRADEAKHAEWLRQTEGRGF